MKGRSDDLARLAIVPHPFASSRPGAKQWAGLGVVASLAVLVDQLSKHLVAARLSAGARFEALGPIWLSHTDNRGIALGVLGEQSWLVAGGKTAVILLAVAYFVLKPTERARWAALGLVVGGSLVNLVEVLRAGHVTDFVGVHFLPVFNLADVSILAGVALLALRVVRTSARRPLTFG